MEAERPGGSVTSAPGRRRKTEQAYEPPRAMDAGRGPAVTLPSLPQRTGDDSGSVGGRGVMDRATRAAELHFKAGEGSASRESVPRRGWFTTSAAKQLVYGAGEGVAGRPGRSPALERHLAALSCFGVLPDPRSRYVPVAVKREVWRRDQGCCNYVDRHSGRRCNSRYRIEIDHVHPFALGGATEPGNLRLRCRAHHKLRHAQLPRPRSGCDDRGPA